MVKGVCNYFDNQHTTSLSGSITHDKKIMEKKKRSVEDPEIVERLRKAFRDTGMQQQELADKIGTSRSYVGNVMSGRALLSGNIMKKLAEQGFDIPYILTGQSEADKIRVLEIKLEAVKEMLYESRNEKN